MEGLQTESKYLCDSKQQDNARENSCVDASGRSNMFIDFISELGCQIFQLESAIYFFSKIIIFPRVLKVVTEDTVYQTPARLFRRHNFHRPGSKRTLDCLYQADHL